MVISDPLGGTRPGGRDLNASTLQVLPYSKCFELINIRQLAINKGAAYILLDMEIELGLQSLFRVL